RHVRVFDKASEVRFWIEYLQRQASSMAHPSQIHGEGLKPDSRSAQNMVMSALQEQLEEQTNERDKHRGRDLAEFMMNLLTLRDYARTIGLPNQLLCAPGRAVGEKIPNQPKGGRPRCAGNPATHAPCSSSNLLFDLTKALGHLYETIKTKTFYPTIEFRVVTQERDQELFQHAGKPTQSPRALVPKDALIVPTTETSDERPDIPGLELEAIIVADIPVEASDRQVKDCYRTPITGMRLSRQAAREYRLLDEYLSMLLPIDGLREQWMARDQRLEGFFECRSCGAVVLGEILVSFIPRHWDEACCFCGSKSMKVRKRVTFGEWNAAFCGQCYGMYLLKA
ncbi:MAG: hypothetical protein MN733_35785, partial [Nitrososphaera sp.]|nr:hypothetical protein [Nitrososphaera sp.]